MRFDVCSQRDEERSTEMIGVLWRCRNEPKEKQTDTRQDAAAALALPAAACSFFLCLGGPTTPKG